MRLKRIRSANDARRPWWDHFSRRGSGLANGMPTAMPRESVVARASNTNRGNGYRNLCKKCDGIIPRPAGHWMEIIRRAVLLVLKLTGDNAAVDGGRRSSSYAGTRHR